MKLTPNLGPKARIGYMVFGLLLIAAAVLAPFPEPWRRIGLGLVGAIVVLEGAAGF